MKPVNLTVFQLFERQQRYVVPLFQRQYVWNREKHWIPLWEDISSKAEEVLSYKRGDRQEPSNHFLGAIVLNPIKTSGLQVTAKSIIDGQQRLTTIQIILFALRDFLENSGLPDLIQTINLHTENTCKMEKQEEKYKVWPTNADRIDFTTIFKIGSPEGLSKLYPRRIRQGHHKPDPLPLLVDCYLYFYQEIRSFVNIDNNDDGLFTIEDQVERVTALVESFMRHLELVSIDLDDGDNPQVIFETLNFRGEPLSPSDLIRNFVFLEASRTGIDIELAYNKYWFIYDQKGPKGEQNFWKQDERQGRITRQRIDLFVFHYLVSQTSQDIAITQLYQEFRSWWLRSPRNVEFELSEIERHSSIFRLFYVPDLSTRKGIFYRRLRILDVTTIYPLILYLLSSSSDTIKENEVDEIFLDLESYLVRRMVCGLTTKNYNNIFISILRGCKRSDQITRSLVRKILVEFSGDGGRWPNDEEFHKAWLSRPAYISPAFRVKLILEALESAMHTHFSEPPFYDASKLSIEHIMPQDWTPNYPIPTSITIDEIPQFKAQRDIIIHTIGNLTLVTPEFNSKASNDPFSKKREEFAKYSSLRISAMLQSPEIRDPNEWVERDIIKRSEQFFKYALDIWPYGTE